MSSLLQDGWTRVVPHFSQTTSVNWGFTRAKFSESAPALAGTARGELDYGHP
jgi:hypothetical protein